MTRTKSPNPKAHITATIDPEIRSAMKTFNADEKNFVDGKDGTKVPPGTSWIVNAALKAFLRNP